MLEIRRLRPSLTLILIAGNGLLVALALCAVTWLVLQKAETDLTARMLRGVESRISMLAARINDLGPLHLESDGLYAGGQRLNDWNIVIDEMEQASGGGSAAIIQGDTRIAASMIPGSSGRYVGSKVEPAIVAAVEGRGESLTVRFDLKGVPRISRFEPLRDPQGHVLGMIGHGVTLEQVAASLAAMRERAVLVAASVLALTGLALWWLIRRALEPVRHLAAVLQLVAAGNLTADSSVARAAARRDEVGALARAVVAVQAATIRTRSAEAAAKRLAEQNRGLYQETHTDALTGVANRRCFDDRLGVAWAAALAAGEPLGLIMIDIDHFKKFNDYYGHQGGDDCLVKVAGQASRQLRAEDLVARYGGEEFAVIMPDARIAVVAAVAERIRAAVAAMGVPHAGVGDKTSVSISLGVASIVPRGGEGSRRLIELADQSLYEAKRGGRDQVGSNAAELADGTRAMADARSRQVRGSEAAFRHR